MRTFVQNDVQLSGTFLSCLKEGTLLQLSRTLKIAIAIFFVFLWKCLDKKEIRIFFFKYPQGKGTVPIAHPGQSLIRYCDTQDKKFQLVTPEKRYCMVWNSNFTHFDSIPL